MCVSSEIVGACVEYPTPICGLFVGYCGIVVGFAAGA